MNADPARFLHGERGARVVLIPQSAAEWIYYRCQLRDVRARNAPADPEIVAALVALSLAALEAPPGSDPRNRAGTEPEPDGQSTQTTLTTSAAADRLRVSTRAIVKAIGSGRLQATKNDGGRWSINPHDLDQYRR